MGKKLSFFHSYGEKTEFFHSHKEKTRNSTTANHEMKKPKTPKITIKPDTASIIHKSVGFKLSAKEGFFIHALKNMYNMYIL
jgi:hypothetical protein